MDYLRVLNIARFICVYVLLSSTVVSGRQDYFVNSTKATWETAVSSCTLATPDIKLSPGGDRVETEVPGLDLTVRDSFWLGYIVTYGIIQYIGCAKSNYINSIAEEHYMPWLHPRLCFWKCRHTTYIGLGKTKGKEVCYCVNSLLNITEARETECKQPCFPRRLLCGGDNFVSLYETVPDFSVDNVSFGNSLRDEECIVYDTSNDVFRWFKCSSSGKERFSSLCQTDNGTLIVDSLLVANWEQAIERCFETNSFPARHHYISSIPKEHAKYSSMLWTSMFRYLVLIKYTEHKQTTYRDSNAIFANDLAHLQTKYMEGQERKQIVTLVYLDIRDNTTFCMVTPLSTLRLKSVCQNETISPTSPPTTAAATRVEQTTFIDSGQTSRTGPESTEDYIYIVIAVVGLLLIVSIITVVVIVRNRRRSGNTTDNETNQYEIPLTGPSDAVYTELEQAEDVHTNIPPTTRRRPGNTTDNETNQYEILLAGPSDAVYTELEQAEAVHTNIPPTTRRRPGNTTDNETNQYEIPLAGPSDAVYTELEQAEAVHTNIPPTTRRRPGNTTDNETNQYEILLAGPSDAVYTEHEQAEAVHTNIPPTTRRLSRNTNGNENNQYEIPLAGPSDAVYTELEQAKAVHTNIPPTTRRRSGNTTDNETNQYEIPLAGPSDAVYTELEHTEADYTNVQPTTM